MSLDPKTVSVLRSIHGEVCASVAAYAGSIRTHVASRLLEAAHCGKKSAQELKLIGLGALLEAKAIDVDANCPATTETGRRCASESSE
jgi:membrane protein involved in colicin uptake